MRLSLAVLLLASCGDWLPPNPCQACYARGLACEEKIVTVGGTKMVKTACLVREEIGMRPLDVDGGLPAK